MSPCERKKRSNYLSAADSQLRVEEKSEEYWGPARNVNKWRIETRTKISFVASSGYHDCSNFSGWPGLAQFSSSGSLDSTCSPGFFFLFIFGLNMFKLDPLNAMIFSPPLLNGFSSGCSANEIMYFPLFFPSLFCRNREIPSNLMFISTVRSY